MIFFEIKLKNQPVGVGKNNYIVLKNGIHVPRKSFVVWKNKVISEILKSGIKWETCNEPCEMILMYRPKDKYKRDATAIIDGVFNLLEDIKVIKDDNQIKKILYEEIFENVDFCLYIQIRSLD